MSLVLFDIDGTLISKAGVHHKQALIEGIRRATGAETTLDGVPTQGMLDYDLIHSMLGGDHPSLEQIILECETAYLGNCAPLYASASAPVSRAFQALRARGAVMGLVTGNLPAIGRKKDGARRFSRLLRRQRILSTGT